MTKLTLHFVLARAVVYAGERLKGKLVVEAKSPVAGSAFLITFIGAEKTAVAYSSGSGESRSTHTARATRNLIQLRVPVQNESSIIQSNRVLPGRHEIPFDIQLPMNLPSSLVCNGHSTSNCRIKYRMKVELQSSGILWNYASCSQSVTVRAVPRPSPADSRAEVVETRFRRFRKLGKLTLGAKVSDVELERTGKTFLTLSCQNRSSAKTETIKVSLKQQARWRAYSHSKFAKTVIKSWNISGAALLTTCCGPDCATDDKRAVLQSLLENSSLPKMTIPLKIPASAIPTYHGEIMNVSYYLSIKVQTGFGLANPKIRIPVRCIEKKRAAVANFVAALPLEQPGIAIAVPLSDRPPVLVDAIPVNH